jgi:hypothetical protein
MDPLYLIHRHIDSLYPMPHHIESSYPIPRHMGPLYLIHRHIDFLYPMPHHIDSLSPIPRSIKQLSKSGKDLGEIRAWVAANFPQPQDMVTFVQNIPLPIFRLISTGVLIYGNSK